MMEHASLVSPLESTTKMSYTEESSPPPLPKQPPPPPPKPKLSDRFLASIDATSTADDATGDQAIGEKESNDLKAQDSQNMNTETTNNTQSAKQTNQASSIQSQPQPPRYADRNYIDGPIDDTYYNKLPHWSHHIALIENVSLTDCLIAGGSDYGQMSYFTETGDIILEIDNIKVAGLTGADVEDILGKSMTHNFKIITGQHSLPVELREYLSRSFARASVDHKLQELIRENIYTRTVPCTTRSPRDGEIDGVDYTFLTRDKFIEMDKAGLLLESGVFSNHFYGTPFPSPQSTNKANKSEDQQDKDDKAIMNEEKTEQLSQKASGAKLTNGSASSLVRRERNRSNLTAIQTSTLPYGWERIADAHYGVYYIDHINKRTQYERPYEVELVKQATGFGFTLIEIDRGLVVVKTLIQGGAAQASGVIQAGDVLVSVAGVSVAGLAHSEIAHLFSRFQAGEHVRLTFARGYQLPIGFTDEDYDIITLKIVKGDQGFGFTISEGQNGQKVKKILDLERCAALRQSDILLSINGFDLTALTHLDVVEVLKQCPINEPTEFMIKRKKRHAKTPTMSQPQPATASNADSASTLTANEALADPCNIYGSKTETAPECFYQNQAQVAQTLANGSMSKDDAYHEQEAFYLAGEADNIYRGNAQLQQLAPPPGDAPVPEFGHYNIEAANGFYSNYNSDTYNNLAPYGMVKSQSTPMIQATAPGMPRSLSSNGGGYLATSLLPPPPPISQLPSMFPLDVSADVEFEYHQVTLQRTESGFGFRIIGGSEERSNVAIGSIVPNGAAHKDGTLRAGDEIVTINETNVIGASHQEVVQLMASTGSAVVLLIRRKRFLNAYDVTLERAETEGFGFVIISCGNCALIGRIIEGSPAQRCQRLHIRDRIVAVNGVDVTSMQHPEIVNKIKESGNTLHLRIIPATTTYTIDLLRGPQGYGFSIRGGAEFGGMSFYILAIAPNGPAAGLLSVGDEILQINDTIITGMCHADAVRMIATSQPTVRLCIRRNTSLVANGSDGLDLSADLLSGLVAVAAQGSPVRQATPTMLQAPQPLPLSRLQLQQPSSIISFNNPNIVSY